MGILIFAILVILICAMLIYVVDMVGVLAPFNRILDALIVLVGVLLIAERAGLL